MMKLDAEGVHLSSLQLPVLQQFKPSAAPLPSTSQLLTGAGCPLPPTSGRQGTQAVGLHYPEALLPSFTHLSEAGCPPSHTFHWKGTQAVRVSPSPPPSTGRAPCCTHAVGVSTPSPHKGRLHPLHISGWHDDSEAKSKERVEGPSALPPYHWLPPPPALYYNSQVAYSFRSHTPSIANFPNIYKATSENPCPPPPNPTQENRMQHCVGPSSGDATSYC
jgi:hypothetical protein